MYDPLKEPYPQPGQDFPESYWAAEAQGPVSPALQQDTHSEVVIIGAGYTGLSAAYHLAKEHNVQATVLEANQVAWGCSGRNAGFVLPSSGRLSLAQMVKKWDLQSAKNIFAEFHQGLETVSQLIDAGKIECDISRGGYLKVAHTQALAVKMQEQAVIQQTDFSDKVEFCDAERIKQQFMCNPQAFAGMYYPDYFSLNPLKLAQGYARLATDSGVQVYPNSPVIDWSEEGGKQRLSTPQGSVVCDKVIIATNGYTGKKQHALIKDRHFPVLSSVIVTRPLSNQERELIGMQAGLMVMDTRPMKYYYRLLPDGRLLFGGRGAIQGKDADKKVYAEGLLKALLATFPQLEQLTVKYFWSGWVSVSYDDYPRIFANQDHSVLYAMGYCGSGLSFSTQAGKRLAEKLAGKQTLPALPYGQSPLPKFPMAPMRRLGLSLYYKWAQLKT